MSLMNQITRLRKTVTLTLAILAVSGFGILKPAHSQNNYDDTATQESAHVPDTKLRLFIQAQDAVNDIQQQYREAAQNPGSETAGSLQRSMSNEIIRTIEAYGLTVDEYNTILAETQNADGDTARRYHDMIHTE